VSGSGTYLPPREDIVLFRRASRTSGRCRLHELCCDRFAFNYPIVVKGTILQKETDLQWAIQFFMCIRMVSPTRNIRQAMPNLRLYDWPLQGSESRVPPLLHRVPFPFHAGPKRPSRHDKRAPLRAAFPVDFMLSKRPARHFGHQNQKSSTGPISSLYLWLHWGQSPSRIRDL
jgi:hypothetical protein